jgi:putative DNA primase/helicase
MVKEVADEVLKTTTIRTHIQSGIMYRFNGGYYDTQGEQVICAEVRRLLEGICTEHMVKEVLAQIRETTYVPPDFFEPPVNLINLKNGILDINTGELKPHTPELGFLNQLPVEYDPSADCPLIKEFLSQVAREEDIPVLQEWCGYCLLRDYRFHKALFLVGTGSNGKSTFLRLLTTFLGKENVAATSLKDLCENRFASAELYGKLACIHADLPPEPLRYTGKFKMLVGEDLIEGRVQISEQISILQLC